MIRSRFSVVEGGLHAVINLTLHVPASYPCTIDCAGGLPCVRLVEDQEIADVGSCSPSSCSLAFFLPFFLSYCGLFPRSDPKNNSTEQDMLTFHSGNPERSGFDTQGALPGPIATFRSRILYGMSRWHHPIPQEEGVTDTLRGATHTWWRWLATGLRIHVPATRTPSPLFPPVNHPRTASELPILGDN
ncbi:uncharacterized protein BO66DRAFT_201544 [Aspergillus aculeatinus CBS 121060]|uniref:Uncharacterized protein n=1 Tax=Aspergillus aculeatinus CBS 121060 TaxID=1448322 RepID=A0ACD1HJQ6_9EURO|nr:hypothetical protein BO66DRAFT_201544 [Aspergillus aculeatinus CBS 121060]RAH73632.1 hypothetical protein BO66DRAFT_201544 [Aspergillus aculeatinus CBS 121060]